ncbi:MAG: MBL fold metallo-hydrolase [Acidobacteriota bacterium]
MKRSSCRPSSIVLFLVCLMPATFSAFAQRDFSDVTIKTQHVAGNVYMLQGAGGNIGVSAGEDGILIVDDQFAPLAEKIRAALSDLHKGDLHFILNTHYHGDHTGGNEVFGAEAPIIAHDNVLKRLSTRQESSRGVREPLPRKAWPVITFSQSVSVHFNGEEIKVIHFPAGHTDGDSIIFFTGSNVVHMGDDFFAGHFPFIDLEAGGSVKGYARNVQAALEQIPADAKIIPGHGPLSTADDLKSFSDMLRETIAIVEEKMKAGETLDQMKEEGLPPKWASWSWRFIDTNSWIETIYKSLSQ